MELPASAQDGASCERQIVEPQFGGRWDEALELERRAFSIRNGLPLGGQKSFFQQSPLYYYLTSDDRIFTLRHIEDGTSIIPFFEALQGNQALPLNAAAAVARGNKRKAHQAQMSRQHGVIEQQRQVRQAVDVNMNYAKTTSCNIIGNACCQCYEKKGKGNTRR